MIYLILLVFVLVSGALAVLAMENFPTEVQITLFTWRTPHFSLGLMLVAAFLLGAVFLYIVSALSALRDHRELKRLRKRVTELERASSAKPPGPLLPGASTPSAPMVPIPRVPPPRQQ
jgi:uncharacterized integral membrane protein